VLAASITMVIALMMEFAHEFTDEFTHQYFKLKNNENNAF
jgi:hypothetical protein